MKVHFLFTTFIIGIIFLCIPVLVKAELNVEVLVNGCNNDLICQANIGEDINSCPNDCTPAPTPPPVVSNDAPQSSSHHQESSSISNIKIVVEQNTASISWVSGVPTQSIISWGKTPDYSSGSISEIGYTTNHLIHINAIDPNQKYYFSIKSINGKGIVDSYQGNFTTQAVPDTRLPLNVSSFRFTSDTKGIYFRWTNPSIDNFSYVRIVRSESSFPTNPLDGKVVYEGGAQSFADYSVKENIRYYYTLFVKNAEGTYSSGVVLTSMLQTIPFKTPLDGDIGVNYTRFTPFVTAPHEKTINTNEIAQAITFKQEEKLLSFAGTLMALDKNKSLSISIPANMLTQAQAFVVIDKGYGDPPEEVYLMRRNAKTDRIETEIGQFDKNVRYNFSIQALQNGKFTILLEGTFVTAPIGKEGSFMDLLKKFFAYILNIITAPIRWIKSYFGF